MEKLRYQRTLFEILMQLALCMFHLKRKSGNTCNAVIIVFTGCVTGSILKFKFVDIRAVIVNDTPDHLCRVIFFYVSE